MESTHPVIYEEAPAQHSADEQPTNTEDAPSAQSIEPHKSRHQKEENIQQVIHEEDPVHHDVDEQPTITEDAVFAQSTG